LETYELTSVNKYWLSLEFLFSSNATLLVEFGRLKFKRQHVAALGKLRRGDVEAVNGNDGLRAG